VDEAGDDLGMAWRVPVDERLTTWGLTADLPAGELLTCANVIHSLWRRRSRKIVWLQDLR
jgi:hypothetical protein